jgi:hypothetical protein
MIGQYLPNNNETATVAFRKRPVDDEAMLEQDDAPIHGWLQDQGQVGHVISSRIFFFPMEPLALRFDNSAFVSIICH